MRVRGVELAVLDRGRGPVVCFSHGLLWSKEMFQPQIDALSDRFRCVAWDHRGQGASEVPPSAVISIEEVTADAAALIEAMGLGPVHFVGLSMGGFVGMRLAARRPELVRSLVLIDTAADREPPRNAAKYARLCAATRLLGVVDPIADRVMPVMFGDSFLSDPARAELRATWRARLRSNRRSIVRAVQGVIHRQGVFHELGRIRCPTLVLHGEEDRAIAMERARRTADAIDGARLVPLPRAGHTSTIENPEAVTAELAAFLDGR